MLDTWWIWHLQIRPAYRCWLSWQWRGKPPSQSCSDGFVHLKESIERTAKWNLPFCIKAKNFFKIENMWQMPLLFISKLYMSSCATYIHTHAHARTHASTHTYAHTHARTNARTHTHARTHARTHWHTYNTNVLHKSQTSIHSIHSIIFTETYSASPSAS